MSKAMQLLGSKISLISKSEIRYEGILFTLNPNESTLALAKVRMFGTENRPTENPVAARDEVFEFIIFRGQDIKDIRLCEPPAPQTPLPGSLPYDPAIVQHSVPALGHLGGSGMPQASGLPGTMLRPSFGPLGGLNPYSSLVGGDASAPGGPLGPLGSLVGPGLGAGLGGITGGLGLSGAAAVAAANLLSGVGVRSTNSTPVAGASGVGGAAQARKSPSADQSAQQSGSQKEEHRTSSRGSAGQGRSQSDQRTGYNAKGGNTAGRGTRGGRARGRGSQGGFNRFAANYNRSKLKFDEDYDFESANVKFEELKSKMGELKIGRDTLMVLNGNMTSTTEVKPKEPEAVKEILSAVEAVAATASDVAPSEDTKSTEPVKVCYDKAKSFFDSISCEAVERSKGNMQRTDWRQERKLNAETFGLPFNPRRGGYNRGAGGGGGGRGYYGGNGRGGGGSGYYRQQNPGNEGYQRDGGHQRGGNGYRGGFRGGRGGGGRGGQRDGDNGGQQRTGGYNRRNNWQQQENRA